MIKNMLYIINRFQSPASGEILLLVAIGNDIELIKETELDSWLAEKEMEAVG